MGGKQLKVIKPSKEEVFDIELEYDILKKNEQLSEENKIL